MFLNHNKNQTITIKRYFYPSKHDLPKKRNTISILQIIIILVICIIKTSAQSHSFRHYQVENGLSNNTVYCSIQDKNGFLWFGTKDGLNRFDGYHFKLFNIKDAGHTLSPDLVGCLFIDKKNTLWVGCQKGLYTFDRQTEKLVRFINSFPEINSIQIDNKGQLWFISRFSICRYNFKKKTMRIFRPQAYFDATSLCLSEEGDIWASTSNGYLLRFNEATEKFTSFNVFSHSPLASSTWIQKIYPAQKGSILIGTASQGIKQFYTTTSDYKDLLTLNPDKTTIYIHDIIKYTSNEFWFATESGIFILNTTTQKFLNLKNKLTDPYSLSDNAVYSFCKDIEGGIWAGTYFGGVNYYSRQNAVFQKYFPDNTKKSLSGNAVREICEDHFGNLWIGTEDAGLNKMNKKTGSITQFKPTGQRGSISYYNIHGLFADGNEVWIGTFEHGLDVMDLKTGKIKMHYTAGPGKKELKSNFIVCLLQTQSREIYAGTSNSLFKYDRETKGFDHAGEIPSNIFISCLFEDQNKTVWIGTHDRGLYFYNPLTKQKGHFVNDPSNNNSLSTNTINAIYEDKKQNLWVSTEGGGLCKLSRDRKTFSILTLKNGLPSNFIFKVLEDNKNNLWISTSRGLVNLVPQSGKITVYTRDNGLLNDQFNYNSGYKTEDGQMYFGSVKGMISFKPNELFRTDIVPPIFITGFQVQNKELEINKESVALKKSIIYTKEIILPYNESSFSIDFAALSYISPEMTTYSYFTKGMDKEWTEIKRNRRIYFTNLSPGKYVFMLKAASNGNWSKVEKQLIIKILPPWWATIWAYLLYIAFTISIAYYLLRTYHIILEDKKEKEIYEAKIEFFTNVAHEIRTPLTLINGPVENLLEMVDKIPEIKADVITLERNTNRLILLITQILDFRKIEAKSFSIDFKKVNISTLLKESYLNFTPLAKKRNLEYVISCPATDIIALADEEALTKIFSNLYNNAIIYAHKKVAITLIIKEDISAGFTIEFENDGPTIPVDMKDKIFEPFYRLKKFVKQQGTGIGLALAKSLTELHSGSLYLKITSSQQNTFVLWLPYGTEGNVKKNKRPIKQE